MKDAPPDNVELVNLKSSKCSTNCGKGFLMTMKVICKGKESKISDRNEVNIEIQSSKNCTVEPVKTACYGTDPDCPGQLFYFTEHIMTF